MPHFRKRHLFSQIQKGLKFSPLVALLGHRQVGKTTLSSHMSKSYYSLDLRVTRDLVLNDPTGFLESIDKHPTVLDESQLLPELFPAIKEQVRRNPRPGQFILTGSVRFSSRKAIQESLTGRVIYFELLPMDLSESMQESLPDSLIQLSKSWQKWSPQKKATISDKSVERYLRGGGLPGLFALREKSLFNQKIATQLETILERDLRLLVNTSLSFQSLRGLLTFVALHQHEPFEWTDASRATRISRPTIMKIMRAFEALFLIRMIPCEGSAKKPAYVMEDQGEATFLIGNRTDPLFDLTRFLYANLRCQTHYRSELNAELFQYRTRAGVNVPICFRFAAGELGILPILEDYPGPQAVGAAQSFLKTYPKAKIIYATSGKNFTHLSPRSSVIPALALVNG
jgi:predicted AAA+ superfamily ATPase